MTYPQEILPGETYTQAMFEAYFFAADVIIAVVAGQDHPTLANDQSDVGLDIQTAQDGRLWQDCLAGCYYVSTMVRPHKHLISPRSPRSSQIIQADLPM